MNDDPANLLDMLPSIEDLQAEAKSHDLRKGFAADWRASFETVLTIANYLDQFGLRPTILPARIRGSFEDREQFSDRGDIRVEMVVEVKHRGIDFTSAEDFPFETIVIEPEHSFKKKGSNVLGYVIVNRAGTHAAICDFRDRARWIWEEPTDRKHGQTRRSIACPVGLAKFAKVRQ